MAGAWRHGTVRGRGGTAGRRRARRTTAAHRATEARGVPPAGGGSARPRLGPQATSAGRGPDGPPGGRALATRPRPGRRVSAIARGGGGAGGVLGVARVRGL